MPWPASKRACASSGGSTHGVIRWGAAVHSASCSDAERPIWVYLGSCETSVYLLMRMASVDGRGSKQSWVEWSAVPSPFCSVICAELMASSEACDVCGCEPASAVTRTKSGALWRAAPLSRISEWPRVIVDTPYCGG